jgi:hypothetical protein
MLWNGYDHPLILWTVCVPIPLAILAVWGAVTVWRDRREIRW